MVWFDRNPGGKREPEKIDKKLDGEQPALDSHPVAAEASLNVAPEDSAALVNLYKGSRVTGQFIFKGAARIDGNVDGEIQCHGTLTVGEPAEIRAKIFGDVVIIQGKVEGDVVAKEKIVLLAPARLSGDIDSPRLIITEGVVFEGDCSMGTAR